MTSTMTLLIIVVASTITTLILDVIAKHIGIYGSPYNIGYIFGIINVCIIIKVGDIIKESREEE